MSSRNQLVYRASVVHFQTRSGLLTVSRERELLTLDFPARPAVPCEAPPDLCAGLRASPSTTAKARDYLTAFETEEAVRSLQPDMAALMRLDCLGIIATAPGKVQKP